MAGIFMSYRREDSAGYAGRLRESLERRLGPHEVFRDVDGIGPGQDFVAAIDSRLRECRAFLAVIGREWLTVTDASGRRRLDQSDDYVRLELAAALGRANVLVVPVLVEGMSMPRAEDLPEDIRALSRRQAVSLRDETWSADVDRLVAALPGDERPAVARGRLRWAALAAGVALLVAVFVALRTFNGSTQSGAAASPPPAAAPSVTATSDQTAPVAGPAKAIAIPRIAEVVTRNLIYTLLSGSVTPHGKTTALALRIRVSNSSRYDANFWDSTFRLAAGAEVLAPTSGLNEVAPGYALKQGVIRFEVPSGASRAVLTLQLVNGGTADVPLDLVPTGQPGETDRPDTRDALAQAIVATLVDEPRPLASGKDVVYTLRKATARRFVNAIRLVFNIQIGNRGLYPMLFGTGNFRLLVDGQLMAPGEGPSEAVASNADSSADFVFDAPVSARTVVLRGTEPGSTAEVPFDVPASLR